MRRTSESQEVEDILVIDGETRLHTSLHIFSQLPRKGCEERSLGEESEPEEHSVDDYKGKELVVLFLLLLVRVEKQSYLTQKQRGDSARSCGFREKTRAFRITRERDEKAGEQGRNKAELAAGKKRFIPKICIRIHLYDWRFCISYGQSKQAYNNLQKKFKEMEV